MTWLLMFVGFFIGLFVSSFGLLQALICIFFGIPTARKLTSQGVFVNPNPIAKRYFISASILFLIFIGISFVVYIFAPDSIFKGYSVGAVLTLILGLGKIGGNKNNISDFLATNKKYINSENLPLDPSASETSQESR